MQQYKKFLIAFSLALSACSVPLLVPTENNLAVARTKWDDVNLTDLQKGHSLYQQKCGNCHYLHRPTSFPAAKWEKELPEMRYRANLSDAEYEYIRRYLLTMCEASPSR